MSWFDRFNSTKGKEKKSVAVNAEKKAFASVSSGKTEPAKETAVAKSTKPATSKTSTDRAYRILLRPVVTEKSTLVSKHNQYVFAIAPMATKIEVRRAVQHVYGIRPTGVAIVNLPGKAVRYGATVGRTMARKKAIVTLPAGKTIDMTLS